MGKFVDNNQAVLALKKGKTLLFPTETIWGIGCDATNSDAINECFLIKRRPQQKSFIILVDSIPMLEHYVPEFPDVCYDIIDFSERPTTIIYDRVEGLPDNIKAADGSVGIRVTKDENCRSIIRQLRRPIVATSANISGMKTPTCFDEIHEPIKEQVDCILNKRLTEKMMHPSSIIKIKNNSEVKIIR